MDSASGLSYKLTACDWPTRSGMTGIWYLHTPGTTSQACKHCQTEAGSKDCSHSKLGTNVEFIIAQPGCGAAHA